MQLAADTIQRLAGAHNLLTNVVPVMRAAGEYRGQPIPLYRVNWANPEAPLRRLASMEIDARTGEIVGVDLFSRGFRDEEAARKITEQVYTPEQAQPARQRMAETYNGPPPTTNQAVETIANWLLVCRKLGMNPGSQTNLADVDWERCSIGTNRAGGILTPVCCVHLKNGNGFTSLNGGVIGFVPSDMYWGPTWGIRSKADKERFYGTITRHWEDLARNFRRLLIQNFGFREKDLAPLDPVPTYGPGEVGAEGVNTRVNVVFGRFPRRDGKLPQQAAYCDASCYAIMVEFDLNSGEIKGFGFVDRKLMNLFAKSQTRPDDSLPQH